MEKYAIQIFSGGWIVRDMTGRIVVKCPTYEEARDWILENS